MSDACYECLGSWLLHVGVSWSGLAPLLNHGYQIIHANPADPGPSQEAIMESLERCPSATEVAQQLHEMLALGAVGATRQICRLFVAGGCCSLTHWEQPGVQAPLEILAQHLLDYAAADDFQVAGPMLYRCTYACGTFWPRDTFRPHTLLHTKATPSTQVSHPGPHTHARTHTQTHTHRDTLGMCALPDMLL